MARRTFVYVTYIASRAETVWQALLDGEFTRQYWGHDNVSDWQPGSAWEHRRLDAPRSVAILGEVLETGRPLDTWRGWEAPGAEPTPDS